MNRRSLIKSLASIPLIFCIPSLNIKGNTEKIKKRLKNGPIKNEKLILDKTLYLSNGDHIENCIIDCKRVKAGPAIHIYDENTYFSKNTLITK